MVRAQTHWLPSLAFLFCVAVVSTTLAGIFRDYHPVPVFDLWTGAYHFILNVDTRDPSFWFRFHNDHRIVWNRLNYWIEFNVFDGSFRYCLTAIFLTAVAGGVYLCLLLLRRLQGAVPNLLADRRPEVLAMMFCLFAWQLLWIQSRNFTFAAQIVVFLSFLLPLAAFHCFERSLRGPNSNAYFSASILLTLASIGSQANGLFALPVLFLTALLLRQPLIRTAVLGSAAAASLAAYLWDFGVLDVHGAPGEGFLDDPLKATHFWFLYLGGAFYHLAGKTEAGMLLASAIGLVVSLSSAWFFFSLSNGKKPEPGVITLVAFLAFACITAAAVAEGRVGGRDLLAATMERFVTASLITTGVFFVLVSPSILRALSGRLRYPALLAAASLCLSVLMAQKAAVDVPNLRKKETIVGALALELGVNDEQKFRFLSPYPKIMVQIADEAREKNLGSSTYTPGVPCGNDWANGKSSTRMRHAARGGSHT